MNKLALNGRGLKNKQTEINSNTKQEGGLCSCGDPGIFAFVIGGSAKVQRSFVRYKRAFTFGTDEKRLIFVWAIFTVHLNNCFSIYFPDVSISLHRKFCHHLLKLTSTHRLLELGKQIRKNVR